jgi:hypothetical protein
MVADLRLGIILLKVALNTIKPNQTIKTKDIMEVSHEINIYTNLIINNKS